MKRKRNIWGTDEWGSPELRISEQKHKANFAIDSCWPATKSSK